MLSVSPQKKFTKKTNEPRILELYYKNVHYKYSRCGKPDLTEYSHEEAKLGRHNATSGKRGTWMHTAIPG